MGAYVIFPKASAWTNARKGNSLIVGYFSQAKQPKTANPFWKYCHSTISQNSALNPASLRKWRSVEYQKGSLLTQFPVHFFHHICTWRQQSRCIYSCNNITKTWIQISRQNWFAFYSNIAYHSDCDLSNPNNF